MASTPNFAWPTPDDTDPVGDGALDIRTLADAIDDQVYKGGLVFITEAIGVTVPALSISNCFTSTYTNYRIVWNCPNSQFSTPLNFRWRVNVTDQIGANYSYGYNQNTSASTAFVGAGAQTSAQIATRNSNTFYPSNGTIDIPNPLYGRYAGGNFQYVEANNTVRSGQGAFNYTSSLTPNGFSLICATGTATIAARVYGYREA